MIVSCSCDAAHSLWRNWRYVFNRFVTPLLDPHLTNLSHTDVQRVFGDLSIDMNVDEMDPKSRMIDPDLAGEESRPHGLGPFRPIDELIERTQQVGLY